MGLETAVFASADGNGTRWRLQGVADPAARSHYVALKFDVAGGQVLGLLVNRRTEEEVPLDDVRFDGARLSFRLPARSLPAGGPSRSPRLSLTLVADTEFRGYYVDELDRRLEPVQEMKLLKVAEEVQSL